MYYVCKPSVKDQSVPDSEGSALHAKKKEKKKKGKGKARLASFGKVSRVWRINSAKE